MIHFRFIITSVKHFVKRFCRIFFIFSCFFRGKICQLAQKRPLRLFFSFSPPDPPPDTVDHPPQGTAGYPNKRIKSINRVSHRNPPLPAGELGQHAQHLIRSDSPLEDSLMIAAQREIPLLIPPDHPVQNRVSIVPLIEDHVPLPHRPRGGTDQQNAVPMLPEHGQHADPGGIESEDPALVEDLADQLAEPAGIDGTAVRLTPQGDPPPAASR